MVDAQMDREAHSLVRNGALDGAANDRCQSEKVGVAPISLQLVGRQHCDEKVLSALALIEKAMGR